MCKWSHFNPICTKMFRGIFTQSFDAFWGHSKILKIKRKAVSATGSSTLFNEKWMHFHRLVYHNLIVRNEAVSSILQYKATYWKETLIINASIEVSRFGNDTHTYGFTNSSNVLFSPANILYGNISWWQEQCHKKSVPLSLRLHIFWILNPVC